MAIDALGTISSAFLAYELNIADKIRGRRAGTDIVGVIALNTERQARLSVPLDRRSSEPSARE